MTLGSPLVRFESTDEVYGTIFQAVIAHRLSAQCFRSRVVSEFIYTILGLLLAVVMVMLLHRPVYVWLYRSWGTLSVTFTIRTEKMIFLSIFAYVRA